MIIQLLRLVKKWWMQFNCTFYISFTSARQCAPALFIFVHHEQNLLLNCSIDKKWQYHFSFNFSATLFFIRYWEKSMYDWIESFNLKPIERINVIWYLISVDKSISTFDKNLKIVTSINKTICCSFQFPTDKISNC